MADILIDNQNAPSTPAAGKSVLWVDSTTKRPIQTDDAGKRHGGTIISNFMTAASQAPAAATDTYISNSGIQIPSYGMEAGQCFRWRIGLSKTNVGTVASVLTVRIGTNQTTADTSVLALTQTVAQTATAWSCSMEVMVYVISVSATGVITGFYDFPGGGTALGSGKDAQSSTFNNSAVAGQFLGLSINTGTSAAWTLTSVYSELVA